MNPFAYIIFFYILDFLFIERWRKSNCRIKTIAFDAYVHILLMEPSSIIYHKIKFTQMYLALDVVIF